MKSRTQRSIALVLGLGSAATLSSCSMFSSNPPLPKQASIEQLPRPAADTDYTAVVAGGDIIYFPADRAAFGARSEPSAMVVEALKKSGMPFAIAWDLIDAGQQPLLDELQTKTTEAAREQVIARLDLGGTGRAREHCRALLRDTRLGAIQHLALRCPAPLLASVRAGTIPPDEDRRISEGFTAPAGGLESYADRQPSRRSANDGDVAGAYRAEVATQEFAAGRIVEHFRSRGESGKLLVFLRGEDLAGGQGVPRYVAQKLQLRQLILSSDAAPQERRKLLTDTAER